MWLIVCLITWLVTNQATAASQLSETDGLLISALNTIKDCGEKPLMLCFKERALHYLDSDKGNIELTEGISLVSNGQDKTEKQRATQGRSLNDVEDTLQTLPSEPEAREHRVDLMLMDRIANFLGSHTLQFKMPRDSIQDMQRALEETQRKKKGKKKMMLPLLMLLKLKMVALLPLAIGFLALLSFKALIVGKIALLLSAVIGLKKLLESKKESYEVVAHPHYSHDEHGYARNIVQAVTESQSGESVSPTLSGHGDGHSLDAQSLAYGGHLNQAHASEVQEH